MKRMKKSTNVKMNLSLEKDFYALLQENAKKDYVKVATWLKQYLKKGLLEKNNRASKCLTQNGNNI